MKSSKRKEEPIFSKPVPPETGFWQEPDFLLVELVSSFVNRGGLELGVTLFVGGLVVSGTLISERVYVAAISRSFARQARETLVNPSREDLQMAEEAFNFSEFIEDVDLQDLAEVAGLTLPDPAAEADLLPPIRFLHLKDPVVIQPQPSMSFSHNEISIARIRLNAIDGWMVGQVSFDEMADIPPPSPNEIRH